MSEKYSLVEIVKFAIEIEKEGVLFYEGMSSKTENNESKNLFEKLKNDEISHQLKFENILNSLGEDENKFLYHEENEYTAYLHAFIEKAVFNKNDVQEILSNINSELDAIDYAIIKEEDSVKFYENMKEITGKENIPIINMIISEENLHINQLLSIKSNL